MLKIILDMFSLMKAPVGIMSAFAALLGYAAYAGAVTLRGSAGAASVFCLACGAAALNNYQDRKRDLLMERTATRPLPSGRVSPRVSLLISGIMTVAGIAGLTAATSSPKPLIAGLTAIVLYNAIYTPLKIKTQLVMLPGVACGMLPPLVGWLAAGGDALSPRIWYIMILFGTWQIPHFWLYLLSRSVDYRKSGIPTLLDRLSNTQMNRVVFAWIASYALLASCACLFGIARSGPVIFIMIGHAIVVMTVFGLALLMKGRKTRYRLLFHCLSASIFALMIITLAAMTRAGWPR